MDDKIKLLSKKLELFKLTQRKTTTILEKRNAGADLRIFVCQSKMTSRFCDDIFFWGGGRTGGMLRRKMLELLVSETFLHLRALWSKILKY